MVESPKLRFWIALAVVMLWGFSVKLLAGESLVPHLSPANAEVTNPSTN